MTDQKKKKVVVLQSNYIPWKGYFDLIRRADEFVFYDDVQFTKNDWRNRNKIKTPRGTEWVSIPCGTDLKRLINEVTITKHDWQKDHWNRIKLNYSKAEHFNLYHDFFEDFYLNKTWTNLSELNQYLITSISKQFLNINTVFTNSVAYAPQGNRMDRLIDVLKKAGATEYISGPAAKDYIVEEDFSRANIQLTWMDYGNYPEYRQQFPPFVHNVSIIDLLFNEGPEAIRYLSTSITK
ncbi:MAG: WbqC family protein [Cyclobacteriaceae bacterium]|nr:WbqC family protein [Cyclobacteriaceae bacterium]